VVRLLPLLFITLSVSAAPIAGFRAGINFTGFDPTPGGFTYVPISGGQFKPEYVDLMVKTIDPIRGRIMDLQQINDNDEKTWANRATSDFGRNGITQETAIRAMNQMRARIRDFAPQYATPSQADTDYALQAGKLWGSSYTGDTIYFSHGNEMWNVYGTNLPEQALVQARAMFPGHSDFDALSLYQGHRLGEMYKAFKQGVASVSSKRVVLVIEGFAPVTQYASLQIQQLKAEGVDVSGAHLSIAQYAFGSATDPQGPLGTSAQKRDTTLAFVNGALKSWTASHLALAQFYGLAPVVDAYEAKLGTLPNGGAEWVAFQNSNEQEQLTDQGYRALEQTAGIGSVFNLEGVYGFPMDAPQGQFPLIGLDQFDNPRASGGERGAEDVFYRPDAVPDPSSFTILLSSFWLMRRRAA
jgi:hypothetical protein